VGRRPVGSRLLNPPSSVRTSTRRMAFVAVIPSATMQPACDSLAVDARNRLSCQGRDKVLGEHNPMGKLTADMNGGTMDIVRAVDASSTDDDHG
jgi:hypothetical protein